VESYSLQIKPSAVRELEAVSTLKDRRKIVALIRALAANPRPAGSEKLTGQERYRVRSGRFRIVYSIDDAARVVLVVRVGDRRDVYR
jgi:mRNA interferase RelE/StbE